MAVVCTPDNLSALAKCYTALSETQLEAIKAILLCKYAGGT